MTSGTFCVTVFFGRSALLIEGFVLQEDNNNVNKTSTEKVLKIRFSFNIVNSDSIVKVNARKLV